MKLFRLSRNSVYQSPKNFDTSGVVNLEISNQGVLSNIKSKCTCNLYFSNPLFLKLLQAYHSTSNKSYFQIKIIRCDCKLKTKNRRKKTSPSSQLISTIRLIIRTKNTKESSSRPRRDRQLKISSWITHSWGSQSQALSFWSR